MSDLCTSILRDHAALSVALNELAEKIAFSLQSRTRVSAMTGQAGNLEAFRREVAIDWSCPIYADLCIGGSGPINVVMAAAPIFIAGWAFSSGVVQTGPNTYMVERSEWGSSSGGYQKAKAIEEADRFCANMRREILVLDSKDNDMRFGRTAAAEVQFKCLQKGDHELSKAPGQ